MKSFRGNIDWTNLNKTIEACDLYSKTMYPLEKYFGIEYYGECMYGPGSDKTWNIDGVSDQCAYGVGKADAIQVYKRP